MQSKKIGREGGPELRREGSRGTWGDLDTGGSQRADLERSLPSRRLKGLRLTGLWLGKSRFE